MRPYTAAELVKHLGRQFNWKGNIGNPASLTFVTPDGVMTGGGNRFSFDKFAAECTWADDGSPCGIVEPADQ